MAMTTQFVPPQQHPPTYVRKSAWQRGRQRWVAAALVAICSYATAAQQASSASGQGTTGGSSAPGAASTKVSPRKGQADLSGFELDPSKRKATRGVTTGSLSRGGSDSPAVLYAPAMGSAYSLRPIFYWAPMSGSSKVDFRLYDSDMNELYEIDVTNCDHLTYPQNAPELRPGASYSWTIHPHGLNAATPARIVVLSGSEREQVQRALRSISGDLMQQRVQQARIFVDHLLWYDSVEAYSELISAYSNQPAFLEERAEVYAVLSSTQDLAKRDRTEAQRMRSGGQGIPHL